MNELENERREKDELKDKLLKALQNQSQTINYVDNRVDYVDNRNINIYYYGQEPSLDTEEIRRIIDDPESSVSEYTRLKHFNRKDTMNLRIKNKREYEAYVEDEADVDSPHKESAKRGRWQTYPKEAIVEDLGLTNLNELREKNQQEIQNEKWNSWYESNDLDKNGYNKCEEFQKIMERVQEVIETGASNRGQILSPMPFIT